MSPMKKYSDFISEAKANIFDVAKARIRSYKIKQEVRYIDNHSGILDYYYNGKKAKILDRYWDMETKYQIEFEDGYIKWVSAENIEPWNDNNISFKKPKARLRWYKKGKLGDNELKNEAVETETEKEVINLSYELEPLKKIEELRDQFNSGNLKADEFGMFIIRTVSKVFQGFLNRRVELTARHVDNTKPFTDPSRWEKEKRHSIIIYSYHPQMDGQLVIRSNDEDGDIYIADLLKAVNEPEKYPILTTYIRKITEDDPYGEEDYGDD